jgi:hypothetical protein
MAKDAISILSADLGTQEALLQKKKKELAPKISAAQEELKKSGAEKETVQKKAAEAKEPKYKAYEAAEKAYTEVEPPTLQEPPKSTIRQDPTEQAKETFSSLMAVSMLFGALTRQPMLAAMKNMTGVMQGMKEGNDQRIQAETKEFERNYKQAIDSNKVNLDNYKNILEKKKGDISAAKTELEIEANRQGDQVLLAALKHDNLKEAFGILQAQEKAIQVADEKIQGQRIRLEEFRQREADRRQAAGEKRDKPILTKDEKTGQMTLVYPDRPTGKQVVPIEGTENLTKFGMRPAKDALGGKGKGQSDNAQRFTDSMMISANEISRMMGNVAKLPVTASTGFMGTSKKVNSITDIPLRALGLSMTGEEARMYDAVTNGMGKALANLMTQGRVSSDSLMKTMAENKIQQNDSFAVAMTKTANIRQEVEAALEVMSNSPVASENSIKLINQMKERLEKAIPYTVNDVIEAGSLSEPNPDMRFIDAVKKSGVRTSEAKSEDETKATQAFGAYEPNKYTYGINPATGQFARKRKE